MMCLSGWNSVSEVHKAVPLLELPLFILDETGFVNCDSFAFCARKRYGPTSRRKVPIVLIHDLCEDG